MLLTKDNVITNQTDETIIEIYKNSGWTEVKEVPKSEPKKVDKSDIKNQQKKKNK